MPARIAVEGAAGLPEPPVDGVLDFTVAVVATLVVMISAAAACTLVSFDALSHQGQLRRMLSLGPSLRAPRLLLAFFAGLLATAELLRLPCIRQVISPHRPAVPCLVYPLVAHGVAEPGLLAVVLLLLRASTSSGPTPPSAVVAVTMSCLPFLAAHVIVLVLPAVVATIPHELALAADGPQCTYPPLAAALLLALAVVYVPLLISACWSVAAVVINKRLRIRLCALAAFAVLPLPVQVAALALTSVWAAPQRVCPTLGLIAFVAMTVSATTALAILVVLPVSDALVLVKQAPMAPETDGSELDI